MEDEVRQMRNSYKDKYSYPYEKYDYSMQAAKSMATQVDQDMLNQLKTTYRSKIQGFK